ncbi:MAG TPA: hypothetical protein VNT75_30010, partial [Symbiobacteriaceae bacterium]|nr:hypothetical protein [Symbiobacteriaceae bacterium]
RYPAICRTTPSAPVISRSHAFLTCDGSIFAVSRDSYDAARVGAGRGPLSLDGDRLYYTQGYEYNSDRSVGALMALPDDEQR